MSIIHSIHTFSSGKQITDQDSFIDLHSSHKSLLWWSMTLNDFPRFSLPFIFVSFPKKQICIWIQIVLTWQAKLTEFMWLLQNLCEFWIDDSVSYLRVMPPGRNSSYPLVICELSPWVIRQLSVSYLSVNSQCNVPRPGIEPGSPDPKARIIPPGHITVSYPAVIHELYANVL